MHEARAVGGRWSAKGIVRDALEEDADLVEDDTGDEVAEAKASLRHECCGSVGEEAVEDMATAPWGLVRGCWAL